MYINISMTKVKNFEQIFLYITTMIGYKPKYKR
jgi:hypothetical protein